MTTVENARVVSHLRTTRASVKAAEAANAIVDSESVEATLEHEEERIMEDEDIESCEAEGDDDLENQLITVAIVNSVVDATKQNAEIASPEPRYGLRKRRRSSGTSSEPSTESVTKNGEKETSKGAKLHHRGGRHDCNQGKVKSEPNRLCTETAEVPFERNHLEPGTSKDTTEPRAKIKLEEASEANGEVGIIPGPLGDVVSGIESTVKVEQEKAKVLEQNAQAKSDGIVKAQPETVPSNKMILPLQAKKLKPATVLNKPPLPPLLPAKPKTESSSRHRVKQAKEPKILSSVPTPLGNSSKNSHRLRVAEVKEEVLLPTSGAVPNPLSVPIKSSSISTKKNGGSSANALSSNLPLETSVPCPLSNPVPCPLPPPSIDDKDEVVEKKVDFIDPPVTTTRGRIFSVDLDRE